MTASFLQNREGPPLTRYTCSACLQEVTSARCFTNRAFFSHVSGALRPASPSICTSSAGRSSPPHSPSVTCHIPSPHHRRCCSFCFSFPLSRLPERTIGTTIGFRFCRTERMFPVLASLLRYFHAVYNLPLLQSGLLKLKCLLRPAVTTCPAAPSSTAR